MSASALDRLAIFGAPPAFASKLHVGRPNIGDRARLLERINHSLDERWLTNLGPHVVELERRLAGMLGVRHCIAVCNATIGLEIVARALGLQGEVIVPSLTFVATAHALQWQKIRPVFADVDPRTHNVDPQSVEKLVGPQTSGIVGVHLWGNPCAVDALQDIAHRHNLRLVFDAAHAFACSHRGRMIGGFGDAEVFSFHATKFINAFEGGAIATERDDLAERIRLMINFGFAGYDNVVSIGTNGKMSEPSAAMALTSLESIDAFIEVNRQHYQHYRRALEGIGGIRLMPTDAAERRNFQYVVTEFDERQTGVTRDDMIRVLWAENVIARKYFFPGCHRMEPYRTLDPGVQLPVTEDIASKLLILPTGTGVSANDIERITGLLRFCVERGADLTRRLGNAPCS